MDHHKTIDKYKTLSIKHPSRVLEEHKIEVLIPGDKTIEQEDHTEIINTRVRACAKRA